jgi:hypothetical protein
MSAGRLLKCFTMSFQHVSLWFAHGPGFLARGIRADADVQRLHDRRTCPQLSALTFPLTSRLFPRWRLQNFLHYLGLLLDRHDTRCCLSSTCICYTGCFRPGGLLWCSVYIKSRNMIVLPLF